MKLVIDSIDAVAEAFRSEYEERDGKFYLKMEGDNPALVEANRKIADAAAKLAESTTKIGEFRDKNIELMKKLDLLTPELDKFKGLDPVAAREALAKVADLSKKGIKDVTDVDERVKSLLAEMQKPFQDTLAQMQEQVRASAAAAEADRKRADDLLFQSRVTEEFTKIGGKAKAAEFIIGKARTAFDVKDGDIVPKPGQFNPAKPGEVLTISDWLGATVKDYDFVLEPSKGGGAPPSNNGAPRPAGLKPGQTVLKNPTPQELGQFSAEILAGKIVVQNDADVS